MKHNGKNSKFPEIKSFYATIKYCISLSWNASRFYTIVRLAGRIITPACGILLTFIVKYIINLLAGYWVPQDRSAVLILMLCGTLVIALIMTVSRKLVQYCQTTHNEIVTKQLSITLMEKTLKADLEFFDNPSYYDKFSAAQRDSYSLVNLLWNVLEFISSCITFIGSFIVLCGNNTGYVTAMIAAALPSAIAGAKYTKSLYKLSVDQIKGERQKAYIQSVTTDRRYAPDVRLFNVGESLKTRYMNLWDSLFGTRRKILRKRSILTSILECLPEIVIFGIAVDVSFRVLAGTLTIGDYSLYTGLTAQLSGSVFALTLSALLIYDDKLRITNITALNDFKNRVVNKGKTKLGIVGTIEFCNVTFAYPGTSRIVLEDISFKISAAEKVALVGLNGSGKTTVIKLLLRYYDVDDGSIKINGIDIREYDITNLRRSFSVYFQDMMNYSFTLRENMTISDSERNDGEEPVIRAFKESDAGDILRRSPYGLDTYLTKLFEDEGVELSGGQNQKIALARAFYRRHTALILDEPSFEP